MVTRIRELLEYKNLTPTQFADLIGVGRPVMSHILSERNKPSLEVVQRIISAFPELSLPWLLSGTGEMLAIEAAAPTMAAAGAGPAVPQPIVSPLASAPATSPPTAATGSAPIAAPKVSAALIASTPDGPVAPLATPAAAVTPAAATVPLTSPEPVRAKTSARPAPKPFRASQAGPSRTELPASPTEVVATAATTAPVTPVAEAAATVAAPIISPAHALANGPEPALLPFLAEPGKAIRRIVIFYRDGSFADYQPEQ